MATPDQISIYPSEELRKKIEELAAKERRSKSQVMVILAEEALAAREKSN